MGRSSLLGIDRADLEPAGRDTATLGPGDNSDSGSDMAGVEDIDNTDPAAPIDVALRDDMQRTYMPVDSMDGAPSDASGTGERRSAGSDAGGREAADISVDRVFDPASEGHDPDTLADDEDPDLDFVDRAEAGAVLEDEDGVDEGDADADADSDADADADAALADDPAFVTAPPAPDGGSESDAESGDASEGDVEGDGERLPAGGADDDGIEGDGEDGPEGDVERGLQQGGPRGATRGG